MAHYAKIAKTEDANLFIVTNIIVADESFINSGIVGDPSEWVQTSYNTYGNVHYAPCPPNPPKTPDGGTPLRANYAGIGYTYDTNYTLNGVVGVFYAPQPYPSWTLDTETFLWVPPIAPPPNDGKNYVWNESTKTFDAF